MSRIAWLRLCSIAIGLAAALLLLEVGLRLLPTKSGLAHAVVDERQPIARYEPSTSYVWSLGPSFLYASKGRVNNAGFVHGQDYEPGDAKPLLAVIGDSFIEALHVPYPGTVQGLLGKQAGDRGRVYSFAIGGAPLSQYLVWAAYARVTFKPERLVVSVVSNDFEESVLWPGRPPATIYPSLHYFTLEQGQLRLVLVPNRVTRLEALARRIALVRFTSHHVRLRSLFARRQARAEHARADRSTAGVSSGEARLRTLFPAAELDPMPEMEGFSRQVVDKFLDELPVRSGLVPERIAIMVDGMRTALIVPELATTAKESLFGRMRDYLMQRAIAMGYCVVDLHEPMRDFRAATGLPLEFELDYHWSRHAHAVAAEALAKTALVRDFLTGAR